jgi:hypothetical protein
MVVVRGQEGMIQLVLIAYKSCSIIAVLRYNRMMVCKLGKGGYDSDLNQESPGKAVYVVVIIRGDVYSDVSGRSTCDG